MQRLNCIRMKERGKPRWDTSPPEGACLYGLRTVRLTRFQACQRKHAFVFSKSFSEFTICEYRNDNIHVIKRDEKFRRFILFH